LGFSVLFCIIFIFGWTYIKVIHTNVRFMYLGLWDRIGCYSEKSRNEFEKGTNIACKGGIAASVLLKLFIIHHRPRTLFLNVSNIKSMAINISLHNNLVCATGGLPADLKSQGNLIFFQGQGIVREFWKLVSEKQKSSKVREKSGKNNFEGHIFFYYFWLWQSSCIEYLIEKYLIWLFFILVK